MANTRKNRASRRASRKDRKSRRASRKDRKSRRASRKDRKSRRASRKNNMMGGRRAERKSRRASRKNMAGGRSPKIVRRVYAPVGALGTGAGKTLTTAAQAGVNVFGTAVKGLDKTFKSAAGTINATVGKIFSARRRRDSRRH